MRAEEAPPKGMGTVSGKKGGEEKKSLRCPDMGDLRSL